jgi:integrase
MSRTRRQCLRPAEWPQEDREAMKCALSSGLRRRGGGKAAHWAADTLKIVQEAIGHFLGYMTRTETKVDNLLAITCENTVLDWICNMQSRHLMGYTLKFRVTGLLHGCTALYPSIDWTWLREIIRDLPSGRPESRRRKLRQLRDSRELYRLGLTIIGKARVRQFLRPHIKHVWARDGLMIALLANQPLRIKNFTALQLGKHLIRLEDGRWRLRVEADETKNDELVNAVLSAELGRLLDHHLAVDRPVLLARRGTDTSNECHLWITEDGLPCPAFSIRLRICEHTKRELGVSVSPHRFRDAGVTTTAIEMPDRMDVALALLGNKNPETMQAHYNLAASNSASLKLAEVLEDFMKELGL